MLCVWWVMPEGKVLERGEAEHLEVINGAIKERARLEPTKEVNK